MEFFGVDLLDVWRGRLSLRRVGVLIKSLMRKPGRSAFLMAVDERAEWDETTYLLARSSDALELSNYLFLSANLSDEDRNQIDPPEPITRPGATEPEQKAPVPEDEFATGSELTDFFGRMNSL
ncbi:hypothetical protein [Streptomyces flavofungini]|uniref:hypothetical protein n=1 Tax=Streptomyces flavofungini TaxID=68200 RepID=UPI0025B13C3D|nr:hypothetical protein [Streptomyces flavofungini]WJV49915.1 hypothetical protein QUY26_32960 [Streptomyces flavofungini]